MEEREGHMCKGRCGGYSENPSFQNRKQRQREQPATTEQTGHRRRVLRGDGRGDRGRALDREAEEPRVWNWAKERVLGHPQIPAKPGR